MRVFRKVVLPLVWTAIFAVIAVSLGVMAFGSDPEPAGSGLKPTGKIPISNAGVSRGTVENTLEIRGTIAIDPPVSVKATHEGTINHFFLPAGVKVKTGDALFQIKSEETPNSAGDEAEDGEAPKPKTRYHTVVATKSGKVGSYSKGLDDTVSKGDAVASITRKSFRATGTISPVDQYRLIDLPKSATVTINGGPAPFPCGNLTIGDAAVPDEGKDSEQDPEMQGMPQEEGGRPEDGGGASISCRVPDDVRVFDGLSMSMAIDGGRAEDVLVVPVTAVRGLVESGTVWVMTEGEPTPRKVSLGLSDGEIVEVRKGLEEDEEILEFVPGGSSSPEGQGGEGFAMEEAP